MLVALGLALAALTCSTASAQTTAQAVPDPWQIGARGGIVTTDENYNNDGTLWALTIGRSFGPQHMVEVEFSADTLDFGIDYGLEHRAIAINHLTINREPLWDPYFLVGIGVIEFDAPPGVDTRSGTDAMFNLGIGGQWELLPPQRMILRADLRLRYDRNDTRQPGQNGFGDGILSVGLTIPLGR